MELSLDSETRLHSESRVVLLLPHTEKILFLPCLAARDGRRNGKRRGPMCMCSWISR